LWILLWTKKPTPGVLQPGKCLGEYALYSDAKVIALICDNQVFVKQTAGGRTFIGEVVEAPAYPEAKLSFLIEKVDDREWLSELIRITAKEMPEPKPKKKKSKVKKGARY